MRLSYVDAMRAVPMATTRPAIVAPRPKRTYHWSDWPWRTYGSMMSVVTTVLNADTFAATPAMNDAMRPVMASPSMPFGRYLFISRGSALLNARFGSLVLPIFGITIKATMPGTIMMNGSTSFGNAPISGVRWAADRSFADSARWT